MVYFINHCLPFIENTGRNTAADIEKMQSDMASMKRTLARISDVQEEILTCVKILKMC